MASPLSTHDLPPVRVKRGPPSSTKPQKYTKIDSSAAKLNPEEIFERIRKAICFIYDTDYSISKTGVFLRIGNQVYVATTSKDLPADARQIKIQPNKYSLQDPENSLEQDNIKHLPLRLFECHGKFSSERNFLEIDPNETPKIGMKVYFAGFPLGQRTITFHKGLVSSVETRDRVTTFTIDGTVVKGNSGSPVIFQKDGRLYVVGVITSQVIDQQFPKEIRDPHESEMYRIFQANLSTGIGRAIDVRHCYEMLHSIYTDSEEELETKQIIEEVKGPLIDDPVGSKKGGAVKQRKLIQILVEHQYVKSQGAKHEIWKKNNCTSLVVPRGDAISEGVALDIIKTIAEDHNLDVETLKALL